MIGTFILRCKTVLLIGVLAVVSACEQKSARQPPAEMREQPRVQNQAAVEELSKGLWLAGQAQLIDAQAAAEALNRAIASLLENPSEDHLEAAKLAWLDAHREFASALPFIQFGFAPPELQEQGRQLLLALDSWPAQPGYLDTVPGYSNSGIVNDTAIELTLANLRKQHRLTAHEEASTGFHALEIMLWGPTGERTAQQFVATTEGEKPEALAANRRRQLTGLIGQGIVEDVDGLARRWPFAANDLSQAYLALSPAARLHQVRAAHTRLLDEEVLKRLPESSESDVESGRAADSKQALLAILKSLQATWVPVEGSGLADLLLDRHQVRALTQTFSELEELLLRMEDPIELAEPEQLALARRKIEDLAGLVSGHTQVPVDAEEVTPVKLDPAG